MTHIDQNARLADEPLAVRREAEIIRQREIADGMQRRHVLMAEEARIYAEVNFARFLKHGPAIIDALKKL
jgi:hypothetical protein